MEKYVYFRNVSDVADDDDQTSSCLFPLSSFMGGYTVTANLLILHFKCMHDFRTNSSSSRDNVILTTTSGSAGSVFESLMKEFSTGENYFIEIADDVSGKYTTSGISNVLSITVSIV